MNGFEDPPKELMVDDELYHFRTLTLVFFDGTLDILENMKDFRDVLGVKMVRDFSGARGHNYDGS